MRPNVRASAWTESESVPSLASFVPFLDLQPGKPAPTEWVRAGLALARDYCGSAPSGSSACSMLIQAHWQPSEANATAVCSAMSRLQNGPAILISPPKTERFKGSVALTLNCMAKFLPAAVASGLLVL